MSSSAAQVYVTDNFAEPISAQHNFVNNFDIDHPEDAMSAYQRIMHEHTKRQLSTATNSARRRTGMTQSTDAERAESVSSTDS
ncbi:uncharacterized protein M421DRAFT_5298 [Didymella exigua CBS 183.55]|uniref:Uncharacterized protein n=1 Tax=Didymella exigua CBS 183.55 TaxID=1150837 RepID=A0A6A5RLA1_9PLEO|nr:uncharacterized protein M421DRAFT_5298 [Didymella exigua CBS 183.55]KAF1928233.1 hypothetical protein M421DRAFT_5298 [Didymella exigua CBS 183.55]